MDRKEGEISGGRIVVGAILLLGGLGWLLDNAGLIELRFGDFLPVALIVVGVALVAGAGRRGSGGLVVLGILLVVLLVLGYDLGEDRYRNHGRFGAGGDRIVSPDSLEGLEDSYRLDFGNLTIDLSDVEFPSGVTRIQGRVGMGQLVVLVPDEVAVLVQGSADGGQITVFGDQLGSGIEVDESFQSSDYDDAGTRVNLELSVRFGSIEVRRA